MRRHGLIFSTACLAMSFAVTSLNGQAVTLGTWLEEDQLGIHGLTGSGDTFTASPTNHMIASNDNFGERNAARHRVYQLFGETLDFAAEGDEVQVNFDVTFAGPVKRLDSDFRMTLIDTSTNQGIYPVSWDTGTRAGTYGRARFVDNLDGNGGGADGFDPWGGVFNDGINGNDNVNGAGASAAPTENNGATALGLVDGNTVSFSAVLTRDAGNVFSLVTSTTEQGGDVVWDTQGVDDPATFDMVLGTGLDNDGFASVRGTAINSFNGIVFGIFDDDPYDDYSGDASYTVSNLSIGSAVPGDFDGDFDADADDVDVLSANLGLAAGDAADPAMELDPNGTIDLVDHDLHITTQVQDANGTGALIGDLNLDGDVDISEIVAGPGGVQNFGDASVLLASLGTETGALYGDGDLNGDGDVDVSQIEAGAGGVMNLGDASRLLANIGQSTAPPTATSVPEPGNMALLALAGIGFIARRRKER